MDRTFRLRLAFLWLAFVAVLGAAPRAHAWQDHGRRTTGRIAEKLLTPKARRALRALMHRERLPDIAVWMDVERDALKARNPAISRWHYENHGICTGGASKSCDDGNCPTVKIAEYRAVLRAPASTREQKQDAVRFIVHMLGDIHQPLHVGDDGDRGGNDVTVVPPDAEQMTLHAFWDGYLVNVAMDGSSERRFAARLRKQFGSELRGWMAGNVEQWAGESFELARTVAYPKLEPAACRAPLKGRTFQVERGAEYIRDGAQIAARRVAMAGARIAFVLNEALDPR